MSFVNLKENNEDVLRETNSTRKLVIVTHIRKRRSAFFGHVMKRGDLEYVVTVRSLKEKRGRGRPTEMILDNFAS